MTIIQPLLDWLAGLAQLIFCTLQRWVCWFLDYFFQMVWQFGQTVLPTVPRTAQNALDWVGQWLTIADGWLPISDGVVPIFAIWLPTVLGLIAFRLIRRLLPF